MEVGTSKGVQMTYTICNFPDELIVHIMSHMTFYDRKLSRLVCKRWNELSYSISLIKNDWIVVPSVLSLKNLPFLSTYWRFFNLRISLVGNYYEKSNLWKHCGSTIYKIDMHKVFTSNPVFIDIFKFCTNLQSLAMVGDAFCEEEGMSFAESPPFSALKLKCLKLNDVYLTDNEFNNLTENAPSLNEFYLNRYHFEVNQDENSFDITRPVEVSSVVNLIKRQSTQLTHLGISCTNLPGEPMIELLSSLGHQLKHLEITIPSRLQIGWIAAITGHCPNLEGIGIYSSDVDSIDVIMLFSSLKKIKKFSIDKVPPGFGSALGIILKKLEFLTTINLTKCSTMEVHDILKLAERSRPNIKVLILDYLTCVDDGVVGKIAPMVPNIIQWSLDRTYCGDDGFFSIVENNKFLQYLSMNKCDWLTLLPGINELTELQSLSLASSRKIASTSIKQLSLSKLRNLSLFGLPVDDETLLSVVKTCPVLEQVSLHRRVDLGLIRPTFHFYLC